MIDIDIPVVFCPACGEDYRFAYDEDENEITVVCACDEREEVHSFVDRLSSELLADETPNAAMFQ